MREPRLRPGGGRAAALVTALLLAASFALVAALLPLRAGAEAAPTSTAVFDREGRLLRLAIAADSRYRLLAPLASYPPRFIEALLLKEDRWFWLHPGVNPAALLRAALHSLALGDYRAGGSTLTMQVARIAGGYDTRSLPGKLRQIGEALGLGLALSKPRLLEIYLSRAPCGGNIEGFQAASLAYFGRPLGDLSLSESLLLACLQQRPPGSTAGQVAAGLLAARDRLYADWVRVHPEARAEAGEFALPVSLAATFPFRAPHAVDSLLAAAAPGASRIDSTLDLRLEEKVERTLRSFVERRGSEGIHNAASLLLDSGSMEVLAQVGSADFHDDSISGQVDGTAARRSPGSALKPFIYALAFQQGLIHPLTVLKDAPIHFSGYSPDNYDNDFEGPLTARDALIKSRNVPAVSLLRRLSRPDLHDLLEEAGVGDLRPRDWYGVSMALGTAEVTMQELAGLYAMLARGGLYAPLRERSGDPLVEGRRLLGPEAAWMALDILEGKPRPAVSTSATTNAAPFPCAWKTGTSIGFRDAWSVGIAGKYVLAVWVGNFDGSSNPAFVGLGAAGPLMFEILDGLAAAGLDLSGRPGQSRPSALARVSVCAVSGKIATELCGREVETWFIPGVSPIDRCDIHQEVFIDLATGLRRRSFEAGRTRREVMEVWPSDLIQLFAKAGLPRRPPPPFVPGEAFDGASERGLPPEIMSPLGKSEYVLRSGGKGEELPLLCVIPSDASRVFWFLDDSFLGEAARGAILFWKARPGTFVLRATDDLGRSSSLSFKVVLGD